MTPQILKGTLMEVYHDKREAVIDFAPDSPEPVKINVTWGVGSGAELDMQELGEGYDVRAKVIITGWTSMSYPHLSHDELDGDLLSIREINLR